MQQQDAFWRITQQHNSGIVHSSTDAPAAPECGAAQEWQAQSRVGCGSAAAQSSAQPAGAAAEQPQHGIVSALVRVLVGFGSLECLLVPGCVQCATLRRMQARVEFYSLDVHRVWLLTLFLICMSRVGG